MIALDDYQALVRKVEALKRRKDKAAGAKEELLRRLAKEFGCKTVGAAKRLLEKLKDKEIAAHKKYVKCWKAFDKKWSEELKEV